MHQQNPVDAPPESRGTTRIRRTPTESCLHLQSDRIVLKFMILDGAAAEEPVKFQSDWKV